MGSETGFTRLVTPAGGRPTTLKVRRFRLVVVEGPDAGREHLADEDRVTVGTVPGADLVLTDATVSRHHLEIVATTEGFLMRDLGSTNGTTFEGCRVREMFLGAGTRLALGHTTLELQLEPDERDLALSAADRFGPLIGRDPAMLRLFATLERVAPAAATVLVLGETGTGKELVARALHEVSPRRKAPFVVVDAGSFPATLIESELFGHERGAFTGATTARLGAFEEADGGTVFLDELGELPLDLQPKLLRVLEQREVRRLGSNERRTVDVRVVAATNRDLREEVNAGRFRADLYYRLAVVTLTLPPLRDRRDDIPLLAGSFLEELGAAAGKRFSLSERTLDKLKALPWRGNVRELRNFIERSIWLSEGPELRATGLLSDDAGRAKPATRPPGDAKDAPEAGIEVLLPYKVAKKQWTDRFDAVYLAALIERCEGNVSRAAREAELDRAYLFRLLRKHGLRD